MSEDLRLHEMHVDQKGLNMKLSGEPAKDFMSALVNLLEQNGAKNFLTVELSGQGKKYSITIQDCTKDITPSEKLNQLTTLNRDMARALIEAENIAWNLDNYELHESDGLTPEQWTVEHEEIITKAKAVIGCEESQSMPTK